MKGRWGILSGITCQKVLAARPLVIKIITFWTIVLGTTVLNPMQTHAAVPALQLAPLQYEDTLTPGQVFSGYIDVANPTDARITVRSGVQAFRQTGNRGDLEFFDDPELAAAIKPALDDFELGPREAVRVMFTVDSGKLPQGGTYAAIFFRTTPPEQSSASSYVTESAKVGTLLVLTNGAGAEHRGQVKSLSMPWLQLGDGLRGAYSFANTDTSSRPVGFKPQTSLTVLPWAKRHPVPSGLVLAKTTRQFDVTVPGSYLGVLPVTVTDADTKTAATRWVVAVTGWYRVGLPVAIMLLVCVWWWLKRRQSRQVPAGDDQAERLV